MKRFVQAFTAPLILAVGLVQGDGKLTAAAPLTPELGPSYSVELLPGTLGQTLAPGALIPAQPGDKAQSYYQLRRSSPSAHGPGDKIPYSYTVYGLRTGPGPMAFTDRNGAVLPVPSQPRLLIGPEGGAPMQPFLQVPPGVPVRPYYVPLPAPKK